MQCNKTHATLNKEVKFGDEPFRGHSDFARFRLRKGSKLSFRITDSGPLSNPTQQLSNPTQPKKGYLCMAERANLVFHNKEIDGTAMKRLISKLIDHFRGRTVAK